MIQHAFHQLVAVFAIFVLVGIVQAAEPTAQASEAAKKPSPAWRSAEESNAPPFTLTAEEQKGVDAALNRWEQWNSGVKTFDCRFKRWIYDSVFGTLDRPLRIDVGAIKYSAPDRLEYRLDVQETDGKQTPIADERAEHWMFDGKTIWEYSPAKKQVIEYKLMPELEGARFVDGPLSFAFPIQAYSWAMTLFGIPTDPSPSPFSSNADELKRQYYLRKITPPHDVKGQICLEAYPRFKHQANCFQRLELVFTKPDMAPFALRITQPNGRDYTVYQFYDIKINGPSEQSNNDAFRPVVPSGWKMIFFQYPTPVKPASNEGRR